MANVVNGIRLAAGEPLEYYSETYDKWFPTQVTAAGSQGVQIEIKPNYWISLQEFSRRARTPGGGAKGVTAGPQTLPVVGQLVEFWSASHQKWFQATIIASDHDTQSVQVDLKPHVWLNMTDILNRIRIPEGMKNQNNQNKSMHSIDHRRLGGYPGNNRAAGNRSIKAGSLKVDAASLNARVAWADHLAPAAQKLQRDRILQVVKNPTVCENRMKTMFARFDKNKDGFLNMTEMYQLCDQLNLDFGIRAFPRDFIEYAFLRGDSSGKGKMSLEDFAKVYRKIIEWIHKNLESSKVRRDFFVDKTPGSPWDYYDKLQKLGEGTFGIVHAVRLKGTNHIRVLKTIDKRKGGDNSIEEIKKEIANLQAMDHPNIIKMFEYFEDYRNIYIVMESARGGELAEVHRKMRDAGVSLRESWCVWVIRQSLEAIAACHERGMVHKDIKVENIMLLNEDIREPPQAVLIDLGLAELFKKGHALQLGGTPTTLAPEVWRMMQGERGAPEFGPKADIWSLACVLHTLCTGQCMPMKSIKPRECLQVIDRFLPTLFKQLSVCSPALQDLVKKMLNKNPHLRPSAKECLRHPLFKKLNEKEDQEIMQPDTMHQMVLMKDRNSLDKVVYMEVASQIGAADLPNVGTKFATTNDVNHVFAKFDKEKKGFLTLPELSAALMELGVDRDTCVQTANALDFDGNGEIEYSEFVAGCLNFGENRIHELLDAAFRKMDKNGDGHLDIKEVGTLLAMGELKGLGISPSPETIQALVGQMDTNHNGEVSWEEFRCYFTPDMALHPNDAHKIHK